MTINQQVSQSFELSPNRRRRLDSAYAGTAPQLEQTLWTTYLASDVGDQINTISLLVHQVTQLELSVSASTTAEAVMGALSGLGCLASSDSCSIALDEDQWETSLPSETQTETSPPSSQGSTIVTLLANVSKTLDASIPVNCAPVSFTTEELKAALQAAAAGATDAAATFVSSAVVELIYDTTIVSLMEVEDPTFAMLHTMLDGNGPLSLCSVFEGILGVEGLVAHDMHLVYPPAAPPPLPPAASPSSSNTAGDSSSNTTDSTSDSRRERLNWEYLFLLLVLLLLPIGYCARLHCHRGRMRRQPDKGLFPTGCAITAPCCHTRKRFFLCGSLRWAPTPASAGNANLNAVAKGVLDPRAGSAALPEGEQMTAPASPALSSNGTSSPSSGTTSPASRIPSALSNSAQTDPSLQSGLSLQNDLSLQTDLSPQTDLSLMPSTSQQTITRL